MNSRPLDYWLLWLVALGSLAMNVFVVRVLIDARQQVGAGARVAAEAVESMRTASIDYTLDINQALPLQLEVPVSTTVTLPISLTVPIDTLITVPLVTPLGTFPLSVPIQASLPIRLETRLPFRATVPISTSVPVRLQVPIHVPLAETALGAALTGAQDYLTRAADSLEASPIQPR